MGYNYRDTPQGGIPFTQGYAPGTFRRCVIYFTIPVLVGVGLYNLTNRWNENMEKEVRESNPKMVPIHQNNSVLMVQKIQEENKKFLEEISKSYPSFSKNKDEKKEEKKEEKK